MCPASDALAHGRPQAAPTTYCKQQLNPHLLAPTQATAVITDIAPAPSKIGAGGLPKGQVNLGEQDDSFNALW